jgi:hypothetical protein
MLLSKKEIPRSEYPRPQFVRSLWFNLNGEWEFAFDDAEEGRSLGWHAFSLPGAALRDQRQVDS